MRRLLAAALVLSSCAPGAKMPGTAAAGPDAGPAAPDAGSPPAAGTDAGPDVPDGGTPPRTTPGLREVDPEAPYPGIAPSTLLDGATKALLAVAPDGRHAIVSNDALRFCSNNPRAGPPCDPSYDVPLRVVAAASGSLALGVGGRSAEFSHDGRFLFVYGASGRFIARADGTRLRPNPPYSSVGRWLYSSRGGDLVRQPDLDEDASLVLAATDNAGAVLSPDGEAIAYCPSSGCFLQSPIGASPRPIPSGTVMWWAPEGTWLFIDPCTFVDLTGRSTSVCDSIAPGTWAQRAGDTVAFLSVGSAGLDVHVRNLAASTEVVFPAAPSAKGFLLSPDARFVVSAIAESTDPAGPVTVMEASSNGGPWTTLGSHVDRWSMSADSRFVGMARLQGQPRISVDGASGVEVVGAPGLDLSGGLPPMFEPAGGFGKAVFYEWDPGRTGLHSVIGNADGSGDWLRLPRGADCLEWRGHTALCWNGNLYAVRGEQPGLLARAADGYKVAPTAGKIFFVGPAGLSSVDLPGP